MGKCEYCDKEHSRRGKYCGDACKQAAYRNKDTEQTVTDVTVEQTVTRPERYGHRDCQCQHCINNRSKGSKHVLNHGEWKSISELGVNELNRVNLPFDVDYTSVCLDSKYDSHRIVVNAAFSPAVSGQTV